MKGVSIQEAGTVNWHAVESHCGRCRRFWSLSHFIKNSKPGYLLILSILFKSVFFEFPSFTRLIFLGLLTMAQSCIQSTVMPCTLDLIRWNSKDVCGWIMLGQPQMKKIKWRINQVESAYDNTFDNKKIEARWHFYFSNYSTLIFGSPKLPRCQNREHVYKVNNAKYSYSW